MTNLSKSTDVVKEILQNSPKTHFKAIFTKFERKDNELIIFTRNRVKNSLKMRHCFLPPFFVFAQSTSSVGTSATGQLSGAVGSLTDKGEFTDRQA